MTIALASGARNSRTLLITPLPEIAQRPQCQFNRVAGLILAENETVMTPCADSRSKLSANFPKAVRYVQGSKRPPHLTCELLP